MQADPGKPQSGDGAVEQFLLEGQEENVRAFKPLVEGFPDRGSVSSPEEIAQEIVPGIIRGRFV